MVGLHVNLMIFTVIAFSLMCEAVFFYYIPTFIFNKNGFEITLL